ncbi:MAG: InlB B-repeat-containing protein [Treponema sp.]|nr:InlB B-repeat-containing protein [Treponema sp.]MEE3434036.1 InlB B-repeat-containing protein [Treponema sp.]
MKGPFKFFALFSLALPLALCSCANVSSSPSVADGKYLVRFDTDGGTVVQSQTVKRGETAVRPEDPTKAPYLFCGWYKSNLSEEFDFEAPINSSETVKAIWKFTPPSGWHLVIFDTDGGTAVQPLYIQGGKTIGRPTVDPTRSGYSFCGWYKSDLSEEFDFTTPISSNTRIRAKWSGPRKIVFNNNGGEGIMADQTISPCVRTPLNANAFTLAEHKFVGWADSADGEKIYDDKSEVKIEAGEDPLNLYAVWELKFRESKNSVDTGDIAVRRADGTIRYAPAGAWPDDDYPGYSGYESLGVCVKSDSADSPFMINLTQENLTWADAASKYPADGWRVITELQAQDIHNGKEAVNNSLAKIGATPLDMSGGYWVNETTACRFNATNLVTEQYSGTALVRAYMPLKKIGKIAFEKSDVRVASNNAPFTIALSNNGDGEVTYSSSNTDVATVDAATGEVTIVGPGETTIIATVAESDAWVYAISKASYTLLVGEVCIISYAESTVNKLPIDEPFTNPLSNNAEGRITYSSSNTGVARVDEATGQVTIVSEGTATITATVAESDAWAYATKTASYTLKVAKRSGSVSYATKEVPKLFNEDPFTNPITLTGDGEVTYSSSNKSVATVDAATGKVTIAKGVLEGETVITATVKDSGTWAYATKTASYTLKVEKFKGILKYSTTKVGKTPDKPSFTNALTHAGSGNLSYTSSNESVATVDANGKVTIEGTGETTITATVTETDGRYAYDNHTASYTLVVKELTFKSKDKVVAGDIAVSGGKYVPAEKWEEYLYSPNGSPAKGVCVDSNFMVKAPTSTGTKIGFDDAVDKLLKPDVYKFQLPTIEQFGKIRANLAAINKSLGNISGASDIKNDYHWSRELQESPYSLKIYYFVNGQATEVFSNKTYTGYWYIHVEDLK